MVIVAKACAVVVRQHRGGTGILVFRHPLEGMGLIHGVVAPDERPGRSAQRELFEDAGVPTLGEGRLLGSDAEIEAGHLWHFVLCPVAELPERWNFNTYEHGGRQLAFSWHRLGAAMTEPDWNPVFLRAVGAIGRLLEKP